jgi:hypothetical protein
MHGFGNDRSRLGDHRDRVHVGGDAATIEQFLASDECERQEWQQAGDGDADGDFDIGQFQHRRPSWPR